MKPLIVAALSLMASTVAHGSVDADEIEFLPLYGVPPARQWSGHLNASAAENGTMLHYWFAEAEVVDPSSMPIALWLNGGPGSSSILGMLLEMGPLIMNWTGGLMRNPYAWTKQVNLLVLESPAGVGYSYCKGMQTGHPCSNTDDSTARAARAALQDFFKAKFPNHLKNDFYIVGESYAGVYVPTLTKEILTNAPEINIKGIAVGDPCTDASLQNMSMDMLWYAHKHGLLPDDDYNFLWNTCGMRDAPFLARGYWRRDGGRWVESAVVADSSTNDVDVDKKCKGVYRRFLATTSNGISQSWKGAYINNLDLFSDSSVLDWSVPGTLNYYLAQWMNRQDVRKALHIPSVLDTQQWPGPSDGWEYKSQYAACNANFPPGTLSMVDFYREIAPQLQVTIVFNGDTDPCVSYEGTRNAVQKVGFPIMPGGSNRPWFYNKGGADLKTLAEKPSLFGPNLGAHDAGPQFGGQVTNYVHNLSFVTVHGSGHMVPQFRPQAAEMLLHRLIFGTPFSPLLPTDDEIASMTDEAFGRSVDEWTQKAKDAAGKPDRVVLI